MNCGGFPGSQRCHAPNISNVTYNSTLFNQIESHMFVCIFTIAMCNCSSSISGITGAIISNRNCYFVLFITCSESFAVD